jgi:hypothetical protein
MLETLSHVSVQGRLVCVGGINKRLALLFALVSNVLGTQYIGAARTGPHTLRKVKTKIFKGIIKVLDSHGAFAPQNDNLF